MGSVKTSSRCCDVLAILRSIWMREDWIHFWWLTRRPFPLMFPSFRVPGKWGRFGSFTHTFNLYILPGGLENACPFDIFWYYVLHLLKKEHVYSSKLRCWNVERGFAFSKIRMHGIYQASHILIWNNTKRYKKIPLEVHLLFFSQPLWHLIWVAVPPYSNPQLTRCSSPPSAAWSYQVPGVIPPSSWLTRWNDILKMSFHSLRPSVDPWYEEFFREQQADFRWLGECYTVLGGGFKYIFYVHPYLGKIPILTNIFQMGWNRQLEWVSGDAFFLNLVSLGNRQEKSQWTLVGFGGPISVCEVEVWKLVGDKKLRSEDLGIWWWDPSTRFVWSNGLNTIKIGVWSIGKYLSLLCMVWVLSTGARCVVPK